MKKLLSLLLAVGMLLSLSLAFAEETKAPDPKSILEGVKLEPSKLLYLEKPLEITGMGIHFNNYPTEYDGCYYFPAIEQKTNAKFMIDWRSTDGYDTHVATTLASGKLPDIIGAGTYGVLNLAEEGAIVQLDEYLDLIPNIVEAVGEDRMAYWRQADGHIYTIPTIVDVPGAHSVMLRKDWLDKLNMEVPTNWDEWMALWRGIRDNDLNENGDATDEIPLALEMGASGERCMSSLMNAFGIRTSSDTQFCVLDDGTYTMVYEHPRYMEFLQTVQDMYKEGLIDQEFTMRKQAELFTAMDSGLVGTAMTWAERARISTGTNRDSGAKDALWECVAPIVGPHGDQITQERNAVTNVWCITSAAQEKGIVEDILRVFNWNFGEEGLILYNYGIEGKTYDMVDGKYVLKPEIVANGFVDYRATGMEYEPFGGKWFTDAFTQCLFKGLTIDELDDASQSFYNGLAVVNNDYFYAMPQTLETEAYKEFRGELITGAAGVCVLRDQCIAGQISVEEFQQKYNELKAMGLQDVIEQGSTAYAEIMGK
ncbi:MAG: extracellular solute-binding protein [Eubacteriales bacterium]|nr:extracellular solute-binding protein [Eubacteriales bacterium]